MNTHPKILLTGFEPFGEFKVNPTEKIVRTLEREFQEKSVKNLKTCVLPVTEKASEIVNSMLPNNYDYVIHLGLHVKIEDFAIERVAINLDDYRIPDNNGIIIRDRPIDSKGKNAYFVTLPVHKIEEALKESNIKYHLSYSAGTYLCNHLLYTTLNYIEKNNLPTKAGFIHVPGLEKMEFKQMLKRVKAILIVIGLTM